MWSKQVSLLPLCIGLKHALCIQPEAVLEGTLQLPMPTSRKSLFGLLSSSWDLLPQLFTTVVRHNC
jgi:hypothetical protein